MRTIVATCFWIAALSASGYGDDATKASPPPKPLAEATQAFELAAEGDSVDRLVAAIDDLARSGAAAAEEAQKKAVRKKLKSCLRHRDVAVRVAAVKGYGVLALPRTSRDLRRLVDRRNAKRYPIVLVEAAVEAWGKIHDRGTHEELFDLIKVPQESDELRALAKCAARALAGFKPKEMKPRKRYEFYEDFFRTFDAIHAAAYANIYPSASAAAWWEAVNPAMVKTFNEFESLKLKTYQECLAWWKANRRDLKAGRG